MSVKIQVRIDGDKEVKIPISLDFSSMDQSEVVNRDFIEVEVDKAINPIVDYETVRFAPVTFSGEFRDSEEEVTLINNVTLNVNLLDDNGVALGNTTYGNIGFVDDDIKFGKSRFLNTFLRLNFYDSDVLTNQNLISQITIFSKVTIHELAPQKDDATGKPIEGGGLPIHANEFPVRFILNNPITNPAGFAEGYYIYHFKSEVATDAAPKELYMRADFNNASTGISTRLMASSRSDLKINELVDKLHTRYLLTKTNTGFYYELDLDYNLEGGTNNVNEVNEEVTINLYEIKVV